MGEDVEATVTTLRPGRFHAQPGNTLAVRHGVRSERIVSTVASEVCEELIFNYPWVIETDAVAIEQYCRIEARARMLDDYINRIIDETGDPSRVPNGIIQQATAADTAALRAAEALGLSPLSRMKIAKDTGMAKYFGQGEGRAQLRARGAAIRAGE